MNDEVKPQEAAEDTGAKKAPEKRASKPAQKGEYRNTAGVVLNVGGERVPKGGDYTPSKQARENPRLAAKLANAVKLGLLEKV